MLHFISVINLCFAYFLLAILPAIMTYVADDKRTYEHLAVFFFALSVTIVARFNGAFAYIYAGILIYGVARLGIKMTLTILGHIREQNE